jgi:menaquinone-dependent protoporphyrinogen oxidase
MSRILIAYATGEGQTAKIANALSERLQALGHSVRLADLQHQGAWPDPAAHDAVIVAASVHAGRHQKRALRFVRQHRDVLARRTAAFLSVSMSAAATKEAGLRMADQQVQSFLDEAGWRPAQVETVAGALRYSRLSGLRRLAILVLGRLFRRGLRRLGWPDDLTRDAEFTDWAALRGFADRFAAGLPAAASAAAG